jgi:glycyl-tRNA synthetase
LKGWIECVGCADRSAYDLTKHSEATNTKLVVRQALDQPIVSEVWQADLDRKKAGPRFKGDAKKLEAVILGLSQLQLEECKKTLEEKGQVEFNIEGKAEPLVVDKELMKIERVTKKETGIILVLHC